MKICKQIIALRLTTKACLLILLIIISPGCQHTLVLQPVGDQTVAEAETKVVALSATYDDDNPLTFHAELPSFANLLDNGDGTGSIILNPDYDDAGRYPSTISVTDSTGLSDSETLDFLVGAVSIAVAAGDYHTCAVLQSGNVYCWGLNRFGELGYGHTKTIGDDEIPGSVGPVLLGGEAVSITAGARHTCALLSDGSVRCWGAGSYGALGYGNEENIGDDETPKSAGPVPLGAAAVAISAGAFHTCAVLEDGTLRCWGSGTFGQLGYGDEEDIGDDETPERAGPVPIGGRATAVTSGRAHTCAILEDGNVRCWGYSAEGACGHGVVWWFGNRTPDSVDPVAIGGTAAAIAAGSNHTCALLETGNLRCWGQGAYGALGYGNTENIGDNETPDTVGVVDLDTSANAVMVAAGARHTCAIVEDGDVRCWGRNELGQLGYGNTENIGDNESPADVGLVPIAGKAISITAGGSHTCALLENSRIRCWGSGVSGELGYGNQERIGDDEFPSSAGPVDFYPPFCRECPPRFTCTIPTFCGQEQYPSDTVDFPDDNNGITAIDGTRASTLTEVVEFIHTGPSHVQDGLDVTILDTQRVAVIRGRVFGMDSIELPDVNITVLNHPEYGYTTTRNSGAFDLVVNGGGTLTVVIQKDGFIPAQRKISTEWQRYALLDDVILIPYDSASTVVNFSEPIEIARSSVVGDTDGSRQTTLFFRQNTQAVLTLPDGSTQTSPSLTIRATEYTVGRLGPVAMPALLPPSSGYTYAVELSADEARAVGATRVDLSPAAVLYVENFARFRPGTKVPMGSYDRERAAWIGSNDGVVLRILSPQAGRARLDLDGSGVPAPQSTLDALRIDDAELQKLAEVYAVGTELWRAPVPHFSPWDCNWPYGPPANATGPKQGPAENDASDDPCEVGGSIIECQNQVLGERLEITGTSFTLNYRSNRNPGHRASYSVDIPLTDDTLPPGLLSVEREIEIAGRRFRDHFPAEPNQRARFTWDGLDGYGRQLQGGHEAMIRLGYTYSAEYQEPANFEESFGQFSGVPITGNRARQEVTLWREWRAMLGTWDARAAGLGGWSIDVHHAYDPGAQILYRGDGRRRSAQSVSPIISTVAGGGTIRNADTIPALEARLNFVYGLVADANGDIYIAERLDDIIWRLRDGILTRVAGTGDEGYNGTAGEATELSLHGPGGMDIGPDGSIYIADTYNHVIRRLWPEGAQPPHPACASTTRCMTTVAGTGDTNGFGGDGGLATAALLGSPNDVAVAPDGTLYIVDALNDRIRVVGTNGIIETLVGAGSDSSSEGLPASSVNISGNVNTVAVHHDGSVYYGEHFERRVRRVGLDGRVVTVAGGGASWDPDDGLPATDARLGTLEDVIVAPDGVLYIAAGNRIYSTRSDQIIRVIAGTGDNGTYGDGGAPRLAELAGPKTLATSADGGLYIGLTQLGGRVRRIGPPLPGFSFDALGEIAIPSIDGTDLFIFDRNGKHLRTDETLRGTTVFQFAYDSLGRLETITDAYNNVTRVERDYSNQLRIVAPFSQETRLSLDADQYLEYLTNPNNETYAFTYFTKGLLKTLKDPRDNTYTFSYDTDGLGRLIRHEDPPDAGGTYDLVRVDTPTGYSVTMSTAEGRETTYTVERLLDGGWRFANALPDAGVNELLVSPDFSQIVNLADGTRAELRVGPDPRFKMQVPILESLSLQFPGTPNPLITTIDQTRSVTVSDPLDPLSTLTSFETFLCVNGDMDTDCTGGRKYLSSFSATTGDIVTTLPTGRTLRIAIDDLGRIDELQFANLAALALSRDADGRVWQLSEGPTPNERTTTFGYALSTGYLTTITTPDQESYVLEPDDVGRLESITRPDLNVIGVDHDNKGNVNGITPPGRLRHDFVYNSVDLLDTHTPPGTPTGQVEADWSYNKDRQLITIERLDGGGISFQTNPSTGEVTGFDRLQTGKIVLDYESLTGNLEKITQARGETSLTYYPDSGYVQTVTAPDGQQLEYTYQGALDQSMTWSGLVAGNVRFTYNPDLRLDTITVGGQPTATFIYDDDGFLTSAGDLLIVRSPENGLLNTATLDQITTAYEFDPTGFGELNGMTVTGPNSSILYRTTIPLRDKLGRILQKQEQIADVATGVLGPISTYVYTYDGADRLESVSRNGTLLRRYCYDGNGNRLSVEATTSTPCPVPTSAPNNYDTQDRMLRFNGTTYSYTANGELWQKTIGGSVTTYNYDEFSNLVSVDMPGGDLFEIEYVIDGKNRRVGKKVNGSLMQGFLYQDATQPVAELDSNGEVSSVFIYGICEVVPDYMIKNGNLYRIVSDHQGSVRLVVNASTGQIMQRIDYNEFGAVLNDTNPGFQPFGFAGGIYDQDTQLVRFGARDYDPYTGRWTTKDPMLFGSGDTNTFAYVGNDPVNFIDPSGKQGGEALVLVGWGAALLEPTPGGEIIMAIITGGVLGAGAGTLVCMSDAKSKEEYEKHKKGVEEAKRKLKELMDKLKKTKGPKKRGPIEKDIEKLKDAIKGHEKEIAQKWPKGALQQ